MYWRARETGSLAGSYQKLRWVRATGLGFLSPLGQRPNSIYLA